MTELATSFDAGTVRLPMSWETYDSLEYDDAYRGAEYMDGELVVPPGFPSRGHQKAIRYLEDQLEHTLADGEEVISGFGWKPEGIEEEYGPDVMVYVPDGSERRFTGTPLLCVEVTSGNRGNDMVRKRAKYAAAGLRDYWIVDRRDKTLRCHELRRGIFVETATIPVAGDGAQAVQVTYAGRKVSLVLAGLFI